MKNVLALACSLQLLTGSFLFSQDGDPSTLRIWKDATGNFSVEAKFVRINGGQVILQLRDQKEIAVPIIRLSKRDQGIVESLVKEGREIVVNSIGMKLIKISSGTYKRGDRVHDPEIPPHTVTFSKSFHAGVYEVTQGQFVDIMGFNQSTDIGPDLPVDMVSWPEAMEFCKRLSALPAEKAAGRIYRLPTEAEWEYMCRAGTQSMYSFPDDDKLEQYAWFKTNSRGHAHNVGQKKPNPWGLYDMHGNVSEWCMDWHAPYPTKSLVDPYGLNGAAVPFPKADSLKPRYIRVIRGGSWAKGKGEAGSGTRSWGGPSHRHKSFGFRVVMFIGGGNVAAMVKAIETRPDLALLRKAEEDYEQKRFKALVALYKWLENPANNDPKDLEKAHMLLGHAWMEVGKTISMETEKKSHFSQAIKHYNLAIRRNPKYYLYHYLAAKAHFMKGEDDITIRAASNALTLLPKGHPKEVDILKLRALAFENEAALDRSREDAAIARELRYLSPAELKTRISSIRSHGGIVKTADDGVITDVMFNKNCSVSEAAFTSLKGINSIEALILNDAPVTSDIFGSIPSLPNLNRVELRSTDVDDSGLERLAGMKEVTLLNLANTKLSDAGLRHVSNLPKLRTLVLGSTAIGSEGVHHIGNMASLRALYLYDTKVDDGALKNLVKLKDLNALFLMYTNVSDNGIVHLSELRNLKFINLEGTKVTYAGIKLLQDALPRCMIQR